MLPLLTGRSAEIPEGVGIKSDFSFAELRIPGNIVCDAELGLHLLHPCFTESCFAGIPQFIQHEMLMPLLQTVKTVKEGQSLHPWIPENSCGLAVLFFAEVIVSKGLVVESPLPFPLFVENAAPVIEGQSLSIEFIESDNGLFMSGNTDKKSIVMLLEGSDIRSAEGGIFHLLDLLTDKNTVVDRSGTTHCRADPAVEGLPSEKDTMPDLKVGTSVELISAERRDCNRVFKDHIFHISAHKAPLERSVAVVAEDP